jgi:hypothetical protein
MKLEHFAQMRALQSAYISTNQTFLDQLLSEDEKSAGTLRQEMSLKRIQFDTSPALVDELEKVCDLLECSKRQFLEGAVVDALDRAKQAYFKTLSEVGGDEAGGVTLTVVEG